MAIRKDLEGLLLVRIRHTLLAIEQHAVEVYRDLPFERLAHIPLNEVNKARPEIWAIRKLRFTEEIRVVAVSCVCCPGKHAVLCESDCESDCADEALRIECRQRCTVCPLVMTSVYSPGLLTTEQPVLETLG